MAQTGRIFVQTTISKARIPIVGAHISFVKNNGKKLQLLATRFTDENGKTEKIEFETPNAENSQNNINSNDRFFDCDIIATHPLYYTTYIKNVQIFANQASIQEINLLPIKEDADPTGIYETIDIENQNL